MIQSLFILSSVGEVLIERHFRGNGVGVNVGGGGGGLSSYRTLINTYFWEQYASKSINHNGGISATTTLLQQHHVQSLYDNVPPIIEIPITTTSHNNNNNQRRRRRREDHDDDEDDDHEDDDDDDEYENHEDGTLYLISCLRDGLSYVAVCSSEQEVEISPLLVLEFLHRIADVFVDYFGTPYADETAIKDHFSTVYQLLEEMIDDGWPLTTEPNALKAMIKPPTVMNRLLSLHSSMAGGGGSANGNNPRNPRLGDELSTGTVSNMPWRTSNVKYTQNEIYMDIIEEVDAVVDPNGALIVSDVSGSIQCQCYLSGIPDLLLTFQDPNLIDDCSFHPCVRYARYEKDSIISFVPPDGNFELMKYRINTDVCLNSIRKFTPPIYCHTQFTYIDHKKDTIHQDSDSTTTDSSTGVVGGTTTIKRTGSLVLQLGVASLGNLIFSSSARRTVGGVSSVISSSSTTNSTQIVEDVIVTILLPRETSSTPERLTVSAGNIQYDQAAKVIQWSFGTATKIDRNFRATFHCQYTVKLFRNNINNNNNTITTTTNVGGSSSLTSPGHISSSSSSSSSLYMGIARGSGSSSSGAAVVAAAAAPPNISLSWKVPLSSVSGLAVSGLSIMGEHYKPYKGVRNITKSGLHQIRL